MSDTNNRLIVPWDDGTEDTFSFTGLNLLSNTIEVISDENKTGITRSRTLKLKVNQEGKSLQSELYITVRQDIYNLTTVTYNNTTSTYNDIGSGY